MALIGINPGRGNQDPRAGWEKILDAATKAATLVNNGVDIVETIKNSKVDRAYKTAQTDEINDPNSLHNLQKENVTGDIAEEKRKRTVLSTEERQKALDFLIKNGTQATLDDIPTTVGGWEDVKKVVLGRQGGQVPEREKFNYTKTQNNRLSPDMIKKINEGNAIPTMLESISKKIDDNASIFGPVEGRTGQVNPYDTNAQTLQADFKSKSQAFGRYMEGGVLRKEDEIKYEKMFPQLTDTPDVAKAKLTIVDNLLRQKQQSDLNAFKAQGYDITGLELPEKKEVKGDVDGDGVISQAEKWVLDNPEDPAVPEVLKHIKLRKGITK